MRAHLASLVPEFRQHAAQTAVVSHRGNRSYPTTYGEIAQLAGRFAAELDRRNILSGERVVLWGTNSAEWIAAFFGCLLRGVIAVPLDAAGSPAFAQRILNDVAPPHPTPSTRIGPGSGPSRPSASPSSNSSCVPPAGCSQRRKSWRLQANFPSAHCS